MRALLACLVLTAACGSKSPPPPSGTGNPPPGGPCIATGCSATVCAEEEVMTTCEYKPEYACYKTATCERQADGTCGWTQTAELTACLANPPPEAALEEPPVQ